MFLEDNIIQKLKELWPDRWEKIIDYFQKKENALKKAPENVQQKMGKDYIKNCILDRIKGKEYVIKREQEVLKKIIPKDKLEDGVIYLAMKDTEDLCRHVEEARWDKNEGMFWYTRSKFGHTFEDTMDHFADVINKRLAGFTPLKRKNNGSNKME